MDTVEFTFSITAYTHYGQPGIDADDHMDVRDTVQQWINNYASRIDTTAFPNGHDIIFLDVADWSLAGGGTSLQVALTLAIGGAPEPTWPYDCDEADPYTATDYWEAFAGGGCSTNTAISSDAMLEMEKRLNYRVSGNNCRSACSPTSSEYFFNIELKTSGPPDYVNKNDPIPTHPNLHPFCTRRSG